MEARANALAEMEKLVALDALSEDQARRFDELEAEIADLDERKNRQDKAAAFRASQPAAEAATSNDELRSAAKAPAPALTMREVSPYGEDSGESWFADQRSVRDRHATNAEVDEARERLAKHYAAVKDEGGARAVRALSSTTEAEGGYLVAPAHLQNLFARMLVNGATVTQLVSKMPLPPKTDSINLPKQDGAVAIAQHVQNNGLTETSATFTTVAATVYRYGGAQTIPNFLLERSLPGVDQIVLGDLGRQLAAKVDVDIINGTTPEGILNADGIGTATATGATATWSDLYPAIVNAVADVQAAHYAGPDAIVMHPRRWAWCLAQIDSEKRPLVPASGNGFNPVAGYAGPNAGPEGLAPAVPVGNLLGIPVYLDANIPTTLDTDQDRIIVGCFREAMLFQSAPMFGVSTEAQFLKDQTLVRVTQDVAFTAERYPGAFSVISGTALNDTA